MKLKNRILSWSTVILLAVSALCYGAASDYKVTNDGVVHGYGFITSGITQTGDLITKSPQVDVRAFMDGVAGRPTYATWYANQATTDVTAVIQAAINSLSQGGIVYIPVGTFKITDTITIAVNGISILGFGDATYIYFVPSVANKVLFNFTRPSSQIMYDSGIEKVWISGESLNGSVAIRLTDTLGCWVRNTRITVWTGNSSIGIQLRGRDTGEIKHIVSSADIPISIEENPNYATAGLDHFNFNNISLQALDYTKPLINCSAGIHNSNLSFDGYQAWIGGTHGLKADGVATFNMSSFSNIRRESDGVHALGGYLFYFNLSSTSGDVSWRNCLTGGNGWYLRKLYDAALMESKFVDSSGVALDMDSTCGRIGLYNFSNGGGTISIGTGLYKTISGVRMNNGLGVYHSPFAYYDTNPVPIYADNATAIANGLVADDIYRTATGQMMMVYTP